MRLRPLILLAVTLMTALAVAVALMGRTSPPPQTGGPPPTTSTPTSTMAPTTAGTATPTPTSSGATTTAPTPTGAATTSTKPASTTPRGSTALPQLRPFIAAAARMDEQLHAAADAINAAGPPWVSISPRLAGTVKAADLDRVSQTIPAGMPDDLLLATLTVYSDLSSRRAAMRSFTNERTAEEYEPSSRHEGPAELVAELGHGAVAARRFDVDLSALKTLARSTDAFREAPATSRTTGDLLLQLNLVHKGNYGCDARGGYVMTVLPSIRWRNATTGDLRMPTWDSIIPFIAVRDAGGRYVSAELTVC